MKNSSQTFVFENQKTYLGPEKLHNKWNRINTIQRKIQIFLRRFSKECFFPLNNGKLSAHFLIHF